LSSHILAEVQQVCTSATIIGNGRLLASGRVDDLIGAGTSYRLLVPDPVAAERVLAEGGFVVRADGDALTVDCDRSPADITRLLAGAGIYLSELTPLRADLETVFLELTAGDTLGREGGR
ncbi:MAG: transporter ATP-binding protein, partial [Nocardioides sp.]|nr:transporter ATP-binding protein [Nocardioides sp.]